MRSDRRWPWCFGSLPVLAASVLAACASPDTGTGSSAAGGPCSACDATFDVCRRADDYNPCLSMRRYCTNWCASAETCAEACEGADWGCRASDLRRSTCDKSALACTRHCEASDPS